ncbi:hypothetical protein ACJIZ3_005545 [Penstemon smallii]|uniref:DUF3741 domain-containing protein n=1 Tax=Penstemon smallii TaxID=265156 RepID=A0ABD3S5F0_9LAMI
MLSRQDSSLSSSRRQYAAAATIPPSPETHHAKAIGCMSGIIQLFSKYQNPNKRLTLGRKQEKCKPSSPTKSKTTIQIPTKIKEDKIGNQISDTKKLSCNINVPRSPTLPPEIRRSNAAVPSSQSPRTPSSLVAKLMGLEDIIEEKKTEEPIAEKRRQLLQALEKCNEDLESLKRIILSVQSVDVQTPRVAAVAAAEELSPVCVLDGFTRSPISRFSIGSVRKTLQHRGHMTLKKPIENDEPISKHRFFSKYSTIDPCFIQMRRHTTFTSPPSNSRAMIQSVDEVCNDIAWGEKREIGRIGLVLQDYLCKELVEEVVQELKPCGINNYSIPLEGCKRRLCF